MNTEQNQPTCKELLRIIKNAEKTEPKPEFLLSYVLTAECSGMKKQFWFGPDESHPHLLKMLQGFIAINELFQKKGSEVEVVTATLKVAQIPRENVIDLSKYTWSEYEAMMAKRQEAQEATP